MQVHAPKPVRGSARPVAYRRILVPLVHAEESERAVALACQLAADRGATVTAVTVIEIPPALPLDAHMLEEEAAAKRLLREGSAIAELYGVTVAPLVLRARAAGEAIVEQAEASSVEIIVLGAARRRRFGRRAATFGRTTDYVLKHAPCRVMVAASPAVA